MQRKLDWPAAVAATLAIISVFAATAALAFRGPCDEGAVRFLDVTPGLPWISAFLALVAIWRLARTWPRFPWPRPRRVVGIVGSVLLLIVTAFICLMSTGTLVDTLGDPTTGCWS